MRSLLITTAVVTVAIMLSGCREKKSEPVPGPQSGSAQRTTAAVSVRDQVSADCPSRHRGAGQTAWFQGSLEEAFSRRISRERHPLFRY
jgi:hypothetical protein